MDMDNANRGAYVVFSGKNPGVYDTWEACEPQVHQIAGSIQGGYENRNAAEAAWQKHLGEATIQPNLNTRILEEFICNVVQNKLLSPQGDQEVVGNNLKRPFSTVDALDQPAPKKAMTAPAIIEELEDGADQHSDAEIEKVELTPTQNAILELALKGDNIFLTGAAGSGKTVTLKRIIECLSERYTKVGQVQVVAPTGIAALPLDGKTTYNFAGWTPDSLQKPIAKLKVRDSVIRSIKALKVLIIEEISMVENQFLERLNLLLQKILVSQDPFGGVQVIFVGDFHQLPPVKPFEFCIECGKEMVTLKRGRKCKQRGCQQKGRTSFQTGDKWAFKASVWSQLGLRHVRLEQIHRQKEVRFQNILNKIANGTALTNEEWSALEVKKNLPANAFAVRLMSRRDKVDAFNNKELRNIDSEPYSWTAFDCSYKVHSDPADKDQPKLREIAQTENEFKQLLRKEHRYPNELTLKVGAKVVLLSNLDFHAGLVNGSQGQVITFEKDGTASGEMARRPRPWEKRCHHFEDLNHHSYKPVVRFENGKVRTIEPDTKETTKAHPSGQFLVSRTQIPLALAWALSIHKSQGMTLQHVNVSSNDIFETGQLYVGLSRATTLDGLTVTGWSREQLVMDEDVLAFYKNTKWESLGPTNFSKSSSKPPGKPQTQSPTENSSSKNRADITPRRLPKIVDSSPRTTDGATKPDPFEPARSPLSSSERITHQGPHEKATTPPDPSDKTISEPPTRDRGFSPTSPEHTANESPFKDNSNTLTTQTDTFNRPFEKTWSTYTKCLDKTPSQRPLQRTPQRLTKPTDLRPFKVAKPMVGQIRPSIERHEPVVVSSPPTQRKPIVVDIIDLVSSDDEGP